MKHKILKYFEKIRKIREEGRGLMVNHWGREGKGTEDNGREKWRARNKMEEKDEKEGHRGKSI